MKILLILPYDNTYKYDGFFKRSISYAPLTLTMLASLVPKEMGASIEIVDEGVQKPEYKNKKFDIVGITYVTSSANRAYELARYWKSKGSFVVLGGPHATLMPEEAMQNCDSVVLGPAELAWPQLLIDYKDGNVKRIYTSECGKEISCPTPSRDLQAKNKYLPAPTVIASRGCTNHCDFCSIHKLWGGVNVVRPVEEVINEIKNLKSKRILFLDPSPTTDRQYAKKLLKELIPLKVRWGGLTTLNAIWDEELLDLMVRSGCEGLLIGFESISQGSINESGKLFNNVSKYKKAVNILHKNEISVLGCFVLGFDSDTKESIDETVDIIEELEIDLPRFAVLTPFPGTNLFNRLKGEGRILTEDWSKYDTEHVVFKPKLMEPHELQRSLYDAWLKTYELKRIAKRMRLIKRDRLMGLAANLGFRFYARKLAQRGKMEQ